jgi:hypothetical protein
MDPKRLAAAFAAVCCAISSPIVVISGTPAAAAGSTPLSTGLNADGQLGNGTLTSRTTPAALVGVPPIVAIASGREHAYGLADTGRVWAWGDNSRGAVGDGTATDRATPVQLSLTNVTQVEAGHYHGVALRSDGTVWTWGYGGLGQLGLGTTNNRSAPVQVPGLAGVQAVAAGRDMSYALLGDGTLRGWGGNSFGEVGDGTTTRRLSPVPVVGVDQVAEIAGGRNHVVVVRSDRSIWSWGANDYGQLGIGSTVSRSTPIQVLVGPALHVDTGAEHSLAVMADGTVRSWGRSQRGQLGLGSTTNRTTPQTVTSLSGIVEVGDGRDQSFAMNASGDVWAWGYNDSGQLGDGSTATRTSPVHLAITGIVAAQGGRGMTIFLPAVADPDVIAPDAPGTPSGTSTVAGRADLNWTAATDDRATTLTYRVFRDGAASPSATTTGPTSGVISWSDAGLVAGSVHTWRVSAFDGTNEGPLSAVSDPITIASAPPGTTVLLDRDFAAGLTGWTNVSGLTIDSTAGSPADAPPSARVAVVNAAGSGRVALPSRVGAACTAFDVRITSISGTARAALVKLRASNGSSIARVQIDSLRRVSVRNDITGAMLNTTVTLAAGTWTNVRLCVTVATAGQLRVEVNGAVAGTWSTNTGTSLFATVQLGDNDPRTITANWDALLVTDGMT